MTRQDHTPAPGTPAPGTPAPGTHAPGTHAPGSSPAGRGSSGYIGVSWEKRDQYWVAHISVNRKQQHLGCFKDEVAAARAYDEAAREAFGEFATLNFPTDEERQRAASWFDRDAACRFFGVSWYVWKRWVREGRVAGGRLVHSPRGGRRRVYTREELERIKDDMFGDDKLYRESDGHYHVPNGLIRRQEAWRMFGVSISVWERWEREGQIQCGMREGSGPKLYRIEDIKRLLEEHGRFSPPYRDPERPGAYRVPLGGYGITRREAIIDAGSLNLIKGGRCHLASSDDGAFVSVFIGNEQIPLRRVIMGVTDRNRQVGHRNGDPLDCRRENLIVRSCEQRSWTMKKRKLINGKPPTSQYKGVAWETATMKWRAGIKAHGKFHSLGRFHDEDEAAMAYDAAARRLFGDHAWLNYPREGERGAHDADATGAETTPSRTAA